MTAGNDTEVSLEKGHQSSSERQEETPKRGLGETNLTNLAIDPAEPPKKMGRFELIDVSVNT